MASSAAQPRRAWTAFGVVTVLAAFGGLLLSPITVRAAAPAVVITDARSVWNGTVHQGSWLPIEIGLRAGSAEFDGHVAVTVAPPNSGNGPGCFQSGNGVICRSGPGFGGGSSPSNVEYDVPVVLAAGVAKTVGMTILPGSSMLTVQVVSSGGAVVASTSADLDISSGTNRAVVAVVSSDGSAFDGLGAARLPTEDRVSVIHLRPGDLPGSAAVLGSFDLVVLDHAPTDTLTPEQRQALADYVAGGGALLIAGGAEAKATLAGLPAGLAPVTLQGTTPLADLSQFRAAAGLPPTGGALVASTIQPQGSVVMRERGLPLLTTRRYGSGRVDFLAVDPAAEPLRSWTGTPTLLRQLLVRCTHLASNGATARFAKFGAPSRTQAPLANESGLLAGAVLTVPGVSLPDPARLGGLLAGYVVVVGPFTYLLLRRARRRDLLWVTVPVVAALATTLSYTTGLGATGRGPTLTEVRLLQLAPGSDRADVATFATLFAPHGGTHTLQLPGDPVVTSLPGADGSLLIVHPAASPEQVELHNDIATLRGWSSTRTGAVQGAIRTSLHFDGSTLTGEVTNGLSSDLSNVSIAAASRAPIRIGSLHRGQTQQINVTLPAPNSNNGPSFFGGGGCLGCGAPLGGSAADRLQFQRDQVSAALDNIAGVTGSSVPVLVGLAVNPLLSADVQGEGADSSPIDAVVVPLGAPVDASHGMSNAAAALVDVIAGSTNTLSGASTDSAVYEASLPGGAAAWTNVQVSVDVNCGPGPCAVAYGGSPGNVQIAPQPAPGLAVPVPVPGPRSTIGATPTAAGVQIWDMRAQRWVDVPTSSAGGTVNFTVPDLRSDVDGDGDLWVRVDGINASYPGTLRVNADGTGAKA